MLTGLVIGLIGGNGRLGGIGGGWRTGSFLISEIAASGIRSLSPLDGLVVTGWRGTEGFCGKVSPELDLIIARITFTGPWANCVGGSRTRLWWRVVVDGWGKFWMNEKVRN